MYVWGEDSKVTPAQALLRTVVMCKRTYTTYSPTYSPGKALVSAADFNRADWVLGEAASSLQLTVVRPRGPVATISVFRKRHAVGGYSAGRGPHLSEEMCVYVYV